MSYVQRVLQPGETVAYATSLHWFVYLRAITLLFFALVLGSAGTTVLPTSPQLGQVLLAVGGLLLLFGLWRLAGAAIARRSTEFAITNRRVIYKVGLIRRHTFEMNLSKVESVGVEQSVLGRMLDFGEVELKGTGSSLAPVRLISHPLEFRSHITAGD